ncbi:MAG TPA: hypothetical protein VN802_15810 [Stellaceae bacterium]|nr:hypothetical protein [Stellaceae bacterium]
MIYQYETVRFSSHPRFHETPECGVIAAANLDHARREAQSQLKSLGVNVSDRQRPDGIRLFDIRGIEVWCWCRDRL